MPNLSTCDDQAILEALKNGNDKAFSVLFDRYWNKVYRAAYGKVNSREIAEEIVQDIFMSLWDKRSTVVINNFSQYLMTAVKYKAIDFIRMRMVQQTYWDYYKVYLPQVENATEKMVAFDDLMGTLEEGISKISEKSRRVFYLNKLEGKSVKEIATILHLSEKAIEYHLTKSLKEIRPYLKDFIFAILIFAVENGN